MVKRISTFPLSISHNSTALTYQKNAAALADNLPYNEFDSSYNTSGSFGGSKNVLINH